MLSRERQSSEYLQQALKKTVWAPLLTPEQINYVQEQLIVKKFSAGAYVCRKGELSNVWIGVLDGLVKLNVTSISGKSMTFTGVPSGGWFGEGSLLKKEIRKFDSTALCDCWIAYMPSDTFFWLRSHSLPFNHFLIDQLNERLGQSLATVEWDRLLGPDARLARCLAALFNPHLYPGIGHHLHISQEEIGFLSGLSRQRVNQGLHILERARLLKIEYGGITILDIDGLRKFSSDES